MADEMENVVALDPERALLGLFDELPFGEKWRRVSEGLKQPHDTGEYKWAHFQVVRLWAPVSGVLVPVLSVIVLLLFGGSSGDNREWEVTVVEPEKLEKLEEPEQIEQEEVVTDVVQYDVPTDVKPIEVEGPVENAPFSPQPSPVDSVAMVKSPITMKGVFGSRNPGARGSALGRYAGRHGKSTEEAVLRALRWLKKMQNSDGSWDKPKPAMTGLALLAYLAHGETPASEEFGGTVERAIKWLVGNINADGTFNGKDEHGYSNPIGAYALCEAFGMTKIPMIKESAIKGIDAIIRGQHATGGWNYNYGGENRDDTSVMGWCVQALKAAKMAALENAGLDDCMAKAVLGMKTNMRADGGWAYVTGATRDEKTGGGCLSGAGVLALQFLGAGRDMEARQGLQWMSAATCDWKNPWGAKPIYYWYYTTQAKFHAGGDTWNSWNNQFAPSLVHNQIVLKGAGLDGKDIGYWESIASDEKYGLVYNTTLCCLMLEVYYRYLPTFKPPEALIEDLNKGDKDEVDVDVKL